MEGSIGSCKIHACFEICPRNPSATWYYTELTFGNARVILQNLNIFLNNTG